MLFRKMTELNLTKKTVLIRTDLNVPMNKGVITSDTRILSSMPAINLALQQNAKVIIMSHLGRPKEGFYQKKYSLKPIFEYLKKKLQPIPVFFSENYLNPIKIKYGEVLILENVRFNEGEISNNDNLAKRYSKLCDVFVMDAFGSAHRMHASTYGIGNFCKIACAGPLLISEMVALKKALKKPKRPMIAIVGGAKVSTKFNILYQLSKIADTIIVGGGIANTFLAAKYNIGKSLHEPEFILLAKKLYETGNIFIPIDSRVGKKFCQEELAIIKKPKDLESDDEIMDFGDETIKKTVQIIQESKTIIWNGPVGVFEFPNFRKGTEMIAKAIANSNTFSLAGGGDTLAVIDLLKIKNNISYISTGGGAFLEFIEGKKLPAIHMLENNFQKTFIS